MKNNNLENPSLSPKDAKNHTEVLHSFESMAKEPSRQLVSTWISLAMKIFERMCTKTDNTPFFVSVPNIISNLAFIISACEVENTVGLRREFNSIERDNISNIQTRELVDDTLQLIREWNNSLRTSVKPGHNLNIRRAICHPKYAKAYTFNTFRTLRRFEVELKIYEGAFEVSTWISKNLKALELEHLTTSCLNLWQDEKLVNQTAPSNIKSIKQGKGSSASAQKNTVETQLSRHEAREMKKAPVLVWASHAIVSIHPDIFEGSNIFNVEDTDCIKIHESPKTKIGLFQMDCDYKTLLLPTTHEDLHLVVFYENARSNIGLSAMKDVIQKYRMHSPCLITPLITEKSEDEMKVEEIYLPTWKTEDFEYSNLGEHFSACLDMNSIFYTGGFGDLAVPDAEPSASPNPLKIPHIQHFSILSLVNSPFTSLNIDSSSESGKTIRGKEKSRRLKKSLSSISSKKRNRRIVSLPRPGYELIKMPFLVILWDSSREMPVYMGKICDDSDDDRKENGNKKREYGCTIC